MAPKTNAKAKGKAKDTTDAGEKGGKGGGGKGQGLKPANSTNVRHILVRQSNILLFPWFYVSSFPKHNDHFAYAHISAVLYTDSMTIQCEKFSKKEEALEKLRNGAKFDDVAREYSEDKARQGENFPPPYLLIPLASRQICHLMQSLYVNTAGDGKAAHWAGKSAVVFTGISKKSRTSWSRARRGIRSMPKRRQASDIILSWWRGGSEAISYYE